jgi:hypothetical protein
MWWPFFQAAYILHWVLNNWLVDWLIDWLWWFETWRLRTAAFTGLLFIPRVSVSRAVLMMPAEDNSWLVYQSSLAVLRAETSGASRRNGWRNENCCIFCVFDTSTGLLHAVKSYDTRPPAILNQPKEGVQRIFIALKNSLPWPGLNQRPLGPVASTLTTTPPRRLSDWSVTY